MPVFKSKILQQGQPPVPPPNPAPLATAGPLVPVLVDIPESLAKYLTQQGKALPSPVSGSALVDTGATSSVVDAALVGQLGVNPVGTAKVGTAGGPAIQPVYPIRIQIQNIGLTMAFSRVTGAPLAQMGLVALLGRDMLTRMVMFYDGPNSEYTLAF